MTQYLDYSLTDLAQLLEKKEVSSVDLVTEALDKIEASPDLHDFVTVRDRAEVLQEAAQKDQQRASGVSALYGLPFSVKDAYSTQGLKTTCASRVLGEYIPPYDATVVKKLRQEGAILLGKNNQDAWGHGGSTENTDFGVGRNPWDVSRVPGGSSGGSAVAVATRKVSFAIGEDTGGSIRNPAGKCNVTGLKVTYGRVSRYGAIAYASSLDTVGPIGKSVADLAVILEKIAGVDPLDATSAHHPVDHYTDFLGQSIQGKVIGLPREFFGEGLEPEVRAIIESAAQTLEQAGAKVKSVSIPYLKHAIPIYYMIAMSETSSNLARYDGVRFGADRSNFSPETMRRILIGTFALSAGYADKLYKNAIKARTILIEEYNKVLSECDVILAPITPNAAPKIGELAGDPIKNLLEDLYTVTVNPVGVPSLALPAGFTADNLPVGMQLIGRKFSEGELCQIGDAYQHLTEWHTRKP